MSEKLADPRDEIARLTAERDSAMRALEAERQEARMRLELLDEEQERYVSRLLKEHERELDEAQQGAQQARTRAKQMKAELEQAKAEVAKAKAEARLAKAELERLKAQTSAPHEDLFVVPAEQSRPSGIHAAGASASSQPPLRKTQPESMPISRVHHSAPVKRRLVSQISTLPPAAPKRAEG